VIVRVFDKEQLRARKSGLDWSFYWNLDEINEWLVSLTVKFPNDTTLLNIGDSYEGRGIIGIKINIGGEIGKKAVMFEGTHHAREWISAATITWMTNEILTSTDPDVVALAKNYEWYIFPVTNPDGYDYSWKKDRFWRKTRKPSSLLCIGTDLNRNWDNYFNQGGTSFNPCADTYAVRHNSIFSFEC
jgi:murein tripeptide amidase MpaA